jgi:hypothetical protein
MLIIDNKLILFEDRAVHPYGTFYFYLVHLFFLNGSYRQNILYVAAVAAEPNTFQRAEKPS